MQSSPSSPRPKFYPYTSPHPPTTPLLRAHHLHTPPNFVRTVSVLIVLLPFLFLLSEIGLTKTANSIDLVTRTGIYFIRKRFSSPSPKSLFLHQDPIFTTELSSKSLHKLLHDRRRLRGGKFENTLVTTCSDSSSALSSTLLSWNRARHVREIIVVDYDSVLEGPRPSLRLVDSIDKKLGRVTFVTAGSIASHKQPTTRFGRARAINLGVAMAAGHNIAIVDCQAKLSPWLLAEHVLSNNTFYTDSVRSFANEFRVIYLNKQHFLAVGGIDERIDIPGSEFSDLALRLRQQLGLRRLSMDGQMVRVLPHPREESIVLSQDSSQIDAHDMLEHARRVPELSQHLCELAREQLPRWHSSAADALQLKGVKFVVLRGQMESVRHTSQKSGVDVRGTADYRLWLSVRVEETSKGMLELMPREKLHVVLLDAHRKVLHNEYNIPWDVLRDIESTFKDSGVVNVNHSETAGQIVNYWPLFSDLVWRKKKLLMLDISMTDAMELLAATSWAIAYAISKDRTLILSGHLRSTSLTSLLDVRCVQDTLQREYNLKLTMLGTPPSQSCKSWPCWGSDDAGRGWDVHTVRKWPHEMNDEGGRHVVVRIRGEDVEEWGIDEGRSELQMRLQRQGFASVCVTKEVRNKAKQLREEGEGGMAVIWDAKDKRDGMGEMGLMWMVLRNGRVAFENQVPKSWEVAGGGLVEWRRLHGERSVSSVRYEKMKRKGTLVRFD